jgi:hypothetical protein
MQQVLSGDMKLVKDENGNLVVDVEPLDKFIEVLDNEIFDLVDLLIL